MSVLNDYDKWKIDQLFKDHKTLCKHGVLPRPVSYTKIDSFTQLAAMVVDECSKKDVLTPADRQQLAFIAGVMNDMEGKV